ncbi:GNAT family N-acetyltransferase [Bacillus sp. S3]|uniref:GNAT family N-acetyltransferase n=1 Tax=Bacillus sp. S3 TaxID=486398 RepID=UPI0016800846|nr:GNAT family N-acetyltransferase [Bacillus sp. S3]
MGNMPDLLWVESLIGKNFKILNGFPSYIMIEQKEKTAGVISEEDLQSLLEFFSHWGLKRLVVSLDKSTAEFEYLTELFLNNGFEHFSSRVEVYRDLTNLDEQKRMFNWSSLADHCFSQTDFKQLLARCITGSANKASSLTMDEYLMSLESELGKGWEQSCRIYYLQDTPLGISIPHIEPGTIDEGRLFYFGLLPEMRGKRLSNDLHLQSLWALKEMGATFYIGSTDIANKKMLRVFENNGCKVKSETESYNKYFSK